MRSFLGFAALIATGFAVVAVLAYPAWLLVYPAFGFPFHRVASRVGYLALAAGLYPLLKRLALDNRTSLGYGLPRRAFTREFLIALALGIGTMLPVVWIMRALGIIVLHPELQLSLPVVATLALRGLVTGVAVSVGEETFTRGAMYSGIARDCGPRTAIVLTAIVYASLHFLGKVRIPAQSVHWGSGLDWIAGSLQAFASPLGIADAFLALAAVGVILGVVRRLTGHIAACIGLHAGWVWVITLLRETSAPNRASPHSWLLSDFDGVVGWLVLGWSLVIGTGIGLFYLRRATGRAAPAQLATNA
ncbi:MAG: CPBP family intramembrane glutamic endopeptidase [Steroidobacteraceae bacterium]